MPCEMHAAQKPSWSHTGISLFGDLSSSIFKLIMIPNVQLWENTGQERKLRSILTDHLKKWQISKGILRTDPGMTFRDL